MVLHENRVPPIVSVHMSLPLGNDRFQFGEVPFSRYEWLVERFINVHVVECKDHI